MSIRRAETGDARPIAVVHVRSWQAAYRGLMPQDFLDRLDPEQRADRWAAILGRSGWPRNGVLVAESPGGGVGFAHLCPVRDDDLDAASTAEITSIYLLSEAWGRGLGRELMTAALAALAGAGYREAALWVVDTNERARAFYRAGGWSPDGTAKEDQVADTGFTLRQLRYRRPLP